MLPIELLSFEAEPRTDCPYRMVYTFETNNGFSTERSSNGRDFTPFALIAGAVQLQVYKIPHTDLNLKGNNYYRLVDIASVAKSYSTLSVCFESAYELEQPYPNPVRTGEYLNLRIPSGEQIENVSLVDVRGVNVRFDQSFKDGLLRITANSAKQGVYYLNVTISGKRRSFKIWIRN